MLNAIVALLALLHSVGGALSQAEKQTPNEATITSSLQLLEAFADENVQLIKVAKDFALERQHWPHDHEGKHHLTLGRNVTMITDEKRKARAKIDMAFMGTRVVVDGEYTLEVRYLHLVCGADHRDSDHAPFPVDSLVPFFSTAENGHLVYQDVIAEVSKHPKETLESHVIALRDVGLNGSIADTATCLAKEVSCPLGAFLIDGSLPITDTLDHSSPHVTVLESLQLITEHTKRHILEDAIVDGVLTLRRALEDPHVGWIFFVKDIGMDIGQWPDGQGGLDETVTVKRRVSILTHPWVRPRKEDPAVWDFNLLENGVTLEKGGVLSIKGMILQRAAPGKAGIGSLAFVDIQQGAFVKLDRSIVKTPTNESVLTSVADAGFQSKGTVRESKCSELPQKKNSTEDCEQAVVLDGKGEVVLNKLRSVTKTGTKAKGNINFDRTILALGNKENVKSAAEESADKGIRLVVSEKDLQSALLDQKINVVYIANNVQLTEEVWGNDTIPVIPLKREVMITSHPSVEMVRLDMGELVDKVQLMDDVILRLTLLDLGVLEVDVDNPKITIPFVNLEEGGVLKVKDTLAFVNLEEGVRLESGVSIKLPDISNKVLVVSNKKCQEVADIECPQKAFHLVEWSSKDTQKNSTTDSKQKGHIEVTNMLVVGQVEGQDHDDDHHNASGGGSKTKGWTKAAIGLSILTAVTMCALITGAVAMTKRQRRKEAARRKRKREAAAKKKAAASSAAEEAGSDVVNSVSIHVNSSEQGLSPPFRNQVSIEMYQD